MENPDVQTSKSHYNENYDTLSRFISYFYQIDLARRLNVHKILEIGIGNKTVSNYLAQQGLDVTTCDFDEQLHPDYVADIRQLPMDNESCDLILACEILEHLPFEDIPKALAELHRVTKKYVIISIPYSSGDFEVIIKSQLFSKLFKKQFLDLLIRIPMFFARFKFDGQHYWKMGRKNYSIRKIRKTLSKKFTILNETHPPLNTYNYFFVMQKYPADRD